MQNVLCGKKEKFEIIATNLDNEMSLENGYEQDKHVNNKNIAKDSIINNSEHYNPTVRLLKIEKSSSVVCGFGFHLTRSKWDPYPWVSAVDAATPAELSGLKAGDCILEVNGEDVLGLRIKDIAKLVKAKSENVTLLLWSTGMDANCDPESLCCGPMPLSLQRLSVIMQNILSIIECPVCLDTIPPPAMQCQNGHLLCVNCRIRAEKCPVCRDRYTPRRALIAEQIYNAITNAFNLCNNEDKLRQKLFGPNSKQLQAEEEMANQKKLPIGPKANQRDAESTSSPSTMPRNKFLAKLWGKACSMDNLASSSSMLNNGHGLVAGTSTPALLVTTVETEAPTTTTSTTTTATTKFQSATNQLLGTSYASNHVAATTMKAAKRATDASNTLISATTSSCITSPITLLSSSTSTTTSKVSRNNVFQANSTFKHFSLSTNDLSLDGAQIAIERCPSMKCLNSSRCHTNKAAPLGVVIDGDGKLGKSLSPLYQDSRRPCSSLNSSVECIQKGFRTIDTTAELNMNSTSAPVTTKSSTLPSTSTATSLQLAASGSDIKNDLLTFSSATNAPSSSLSTSSSSSPLPSTESSLSTSPVLLMTETAPGTQSTATDIPVAASTSPRVPFVDNLTDNHLLKPVSYSEELTSRNEFLKIRFCCPFNCGKRFTASSKLQRHVRVDHQTPILCFGGSSAKLALPLQQPLDDAVLLLEIQKDKIFDGIVEGNEDDADTDDKHVRNDDKRCTRECWIRLKTTRKKNLNGCRIYASALLQGSDDECIDFMLETEVSCQQLDGAEEKHETIEVKNKNDRKYGGIDENKELKLHQQQQQQQQGLLTRSIVHSMETTTWPEQFASITCINSNNYNGKLHEGFDSNNENLRNPTNKNNDAEHWLNGNGSLSSRQNPNDLSEISVFFQNDQNGMQHGDDSEVAEMVLNINVRRTIAK